MNRSHNYITKSHALLGNQSKAAFNVKRLGIVVGRSLNLHKTIVLYLVPINVDKGKYKCEIK